MGTIKMSEGKIPFVLRRKVLLKGGWVEIKGKHLCSYDNGGDIYWEENKDFEAELIYNGYGRGRSSIVFYYINEDNTFSAQMFVSDLDNIIQLGISPNVINGIWRYCKKGSNYGIQLIKEIKE